MKLIAICHIELSMQKGIHRLDSLKHSSLCPCGPGLLPSRIGMNDPGDPFMVHSTCPLSTVGCLEILEWRLVQCPFVLVVPQLQNV